MPENTTNRDPLVHLLGAMDEGSSNYIENMEAQGQQQLVNSTLLPSNMGDQREQFEALGFVFGEVDPRDDLFVEAQLPEGWTKQGTSHSMYSKIVDQRGIERVGVFYKAAFYDRKASMCLVNVGYVLATDAIYAESESEAVIPWKKLTEAETESVINNLDGKLADAERSPSIYGKYVERVQKLLASKP